MEPYFEIILNDKIYIQRTPYSKFTEFTLDGIKENTYDDLPQEIKKIIEQNEEILRNPDEYFEYHIENDEVIIDKILKDPGSFIKIPSHINGMPVVELSTRFATYDYINLNQMQLPHTIKRFNENTFQSALVDYVNIPPLVTKIPEKCFYDSTIMSIDLSNVTCIENNAFSDCRNLKKIDFSNVKTLMECVVSHCHKLETVILPEHLTELPPYFFFDCIKLRSVKLPDSIEKIHRFAFANSGISELNLPKALKNISVYAFEKCKRLTKITMPDNLKEIERCAFLECTNLENVKLNKALENIQSCAFEKTRVKIVEMPRNTKCYSDAFPDFTIKAKDTSRKDQER